MGLKDIFTGFFEKKDKNIIRIYLQDNKCGEKIEVLLRKSYDIQRVYEDDSAYYKITKVVVCTKCYNKIKINITFDKNYKVITNYIENGKFITQDEYNK